MVAAIGQGGDLVGQCAKAAILQCEKAIFPNEMPSAVIGKMLGKCGRFENFVYKSSVRKTGGQLFVIVPGVFTVMHAQPGISQ